MANTTKKTLEDTRETERQNQGREPEGRARVMPQPMGSDFSDVTATPHNPQQYDPTTQGLRPV